MKIKNILLTTAFTFLLGVFAAASARAASPCAPLVGQCAYYSCLSRQMGCQVNDYPEHLALQYCTDFDEDLAGYTAKGRAFMGRVKACLQKQIEIALHPQTTCSSLGDAAPDQHITCYIRSGFCGLPYADQMRVGRTIFATFLADPHFRHTALVIAHACGELPL